MTTVVEISAAMVKDLREKSGAAMMDCKRALVEATGDFEKAFEILTQGKTGTPQTRPTTSDKSNEQHNSNKSNVWTCSCAGCCCPVSV